MGEKGGRGGEGRVGERVEGGEWVRENREGRVGEGE